MRGPNHRRAGVLPPQPDEDPVAAQIPSPIRVGSRIPATVGHARRAEAARLIEDGFAVWKVLSYKKVSTIAGLFREATEVDPLNATAWGALALATLLQGLFGILASDEAHELAKAAARLAIEMEPACEEARCAIAWLKVLSDRDWQGARRLFEELQDGDGRSKPQAHFGRALLHVAEGQIEKSAAILSQLAREYPLNRTVTALLAWTHYLRRDFAAVKAHLRHLRHTGNADRLLLFSEAMLSLQCEAPPEAARQLRRLLGESPDNRVLRACLGHIEAISGNVAEARTILHDLSEDPAPSGRTPFYLMAVVLIGLKEYQEACQALEQAYVRGTFSSLAFHLDPVLDPLRDLPGFRAFLERSYPCIDNPEGEDKELQRAPS